MAPHRTTAPATYSRVGADAVRGHGVYLLGQTHRRALWYYFPVLLCIKLSLVLLVLPIALPGIVTGIALDSAWRSVIEPLGLGKGLFSVIVGHATFCVVTVYNNVLARLRRTGVSLDARTERACFSWLPLQ